tara:strand:- start:478 stop:744 length:267 start_codon:yes stop_codon:yes gene_type:complete
MRRNLKGAEYDIVVSFFDNGEGNCIAKTIVGEDETSVNKYRLIVAANNPITQQPFNKDENLLMRYALGNQDHLWSDYWEDPAPEEGGE